MSADAPPELAPMAAWPKQSWFLHGPLLASVTMTAAVVALITELTIMLLAGEESLGYLGLGLSAFGLLVIFRARWVGLGLTGAGGVATAMFATEYIGVWSVSVLAMFVFAKQGRHVSPAVAVVASALYMALVLREGGQFDAPVALMAATFCVAAAAAGSAVRLQNESWNAARRRALDLAAAQEIELRQAVSDERLRIARDLHDALGHELAVVNVNIGVAEVSLPRGAENSRKALHSARQALQRTLQETQQILTVLRANEDEPDQRTELALLEHIPSLVARATAAGVQVAASLDAALPALYPDVSAAAYRIVQEALTNVGKYASSSRALLILTSTQDRLIIQIKNRFAPLAHPREEQSGFGLVGMRERTQAAGGTIQISENANTFSIHVELPTKASTP